MGKPAGTRTGWLATKVIEMRVRSQARISMSLMTIGQASASTQMAEGMVHLLMFRKCYAVMNVDS